MANFVLNFVASLPWQRGLVVVEFD